MTRDHFGLRISDCGLDTTPAASPSAPGSIRNPQSAIRNRPGRPGFTLIELMVVIVVILILLGIAAGIGQWATGASEERLTTVTLTNLQLIYDEYTNTVGGTFTQSAGTAGTINLVAATKGQAAFKRYYSGIPDNMKNLPSNVVKDAWGATINFVPANTGYSGNPQRNAPYFVSAGRDGNISTLGDNLYSFNVIK